MLSPHQRVKNECACFFEQAKYPHGAILAAAREHRAKQGHAVDFTPSNRLCDGALPLLS
jgi:hypothetical protein